ncbi:MAG: hypothetical protein ACRENE_03540, partial [Polyangiaceae bacterium]
MIHGQERIEVLVTRGGPAARLAVTALLLLAASACTSLLGVAEIVGVDASTDDAASTGEGGQDVRSSPDAAGEAGSDAPAAGDGPDATIDGPSQGDGDATVDAPSPSDASDATAPDGAGSDASASDGGAGDGDASSASDAPATCSPSCTTCT